MNFANNKSRPERLVGILADDDYKKEDIPKIYKKNLKKRRKCMQKIAKKSRSSKRSHSRKKKSPKTKEKFVPGEFIFDKKGQMAEIKYIGECHKGAGTWYGIEFVDGSLGKHNGTIQDKTYFYGDDRRCDMIRANKIRNKVSPDISITAKRIMSKPNKPNKRRARHKRATTDPACLRSISLAQLSRTVSDKYFHTNTPKHTKHSRMQTPPSRIKTERKELLFGSKSREEVLYRGSFHRQYKPKPQAIKTVKKEKYKGNKYILAMEQETEKRKYERIDFIKMDKKLLKQRKHERNSSKMQEILKRKELKKKKLSKLNQENRLRELQRIKAAKQKSKRRVNRQRSQSDYTNIHNIHQYNYDRRRVQSPPVIVARAKSTNDAADNKVKKCKLSMISLDNNQSLQISSTPLVDFEEELTDSNLATVSSEFPDINTDTIKGIPANYKFDDEDSLDGVCSDALDGDDVDSIFSSCSEEILSMPDNYRDKARIFPVDDKLPVNTDSALVLQEMLYNSMTELISPNTKMLSSLTMNGIRSSPRKLKKKIAPLPLDATLHEQEEVELSDDLLPYPIKQNKPSRDLPLNATNRSETARIAQTDDPGTEYWIQAYNKMHAKSTDSTYKLNTAPDDESQNESYELPKRKTIATSKSVSDIKKKEDQFEFYASMSNRKAIKRSVSLIDTLSTKSKRMDSAPIVTSDDKGTDYWIQQYNKSNKKTSSKRKSKSKHKVSSKRKMKTLRSLSKNEMSKSALSIINPNSCEKLYAKDTEISPPNRFIRDDSSDVASSVLSDPCLSVISFDSTTNGSVISSLNTSPSTSAYSPIDMSANDELVPAYFNDTKEQTMNTTSTQAANKIKYGGYPFQRKREQYINKRFTGIVRIGHRYLLRDGRIGVVRFINTTRFARGSWIGVELDSAEGEHDGSVDGMKYFECSAMHGTFVKKSQIAQYINRDTTKSLLRNQLMYLNAAK